VSLRVYLGHKRTLPSPSHPPQNALRGVFASRWVQKVKVKLTKETYAAKQDEDEESEAEEGEALVARD
jgi:hypothetical protein